MNLFSQAEVTFTRLQDSICSALEEQDGKGTFTSDTWKREGGGGGVSRVLLGGNVFEKAGVNWSSVAGELPADFADKIPGQGRAFKATGVSLVLHPVSPMVPTTHANFRYLEKGDKCWFGGGADLTPYYFEREDAVHFHQVLKGVCDEHQPAADYPRFKKWCDEYFYLPHRQETRGVGGIFFDYLAADEKTFAFVKAAGEAFLPAYLPIVDRRRHRTYGERERHWQLVRRGRYVEFNLLYDRGTVFGLKTGGRTESILMSLPPHVRWEYCSPVEPGSPEAHLVEHLKPTEWLGHENN